MSTLYPESHQVPAMLIWKVPSGKEQELYDAYENGEYFGEEKVDGAWYEFERTPNHTYLFGRSASKVTQELSEKGNRVPHIMNALSCLPPDTIIIGEIYFPGGTSKDVTKVTGALPEKAVKTQEATGLIHYYLHDIIMYDGIDLTQCGAEERYDILAAVWKKHNLEQYDFLRLAVKVTENLAEEVSRILASGGEGMVFKRKDGLYYPGKRPAHVSIKVKQIDATDLVCCGLCDATMVYSGKELEVWPYWRVENEADGSVSLTDECQYKDYLDPTYGKLYTPVTKPYYLGWKTAIEIGAYDDDGNLVKLGTVSSGLSDSDKENMTNNPDDYIGTVVSLSCMSIDKQEHTLRHPVFKSWRFDKNAVDCRISEIFA